MKKTIYENVVILKDYDNNGNYNEFESSKYIDEEKAIDLISNIDIYDDFVNQCKEKFKKVQEGRQAKYSEAHLQFVRDTALLVAGEHNDNRIKVIPARAGFGKSTVIYSILSVVINRINEGTWDEGIIIVTDKLDDLKNLHANLCKEFNYYCEKEKITYSYVVQSWNSDICKNPFVKKMTYSDAIKECNNQCPFYNSCEIFLQNAKQNKSPILLMSNIKFAKYRSQIEKYQIFIDKDGNEKKRTVVLIDEKPEIISPIKIDSNFMRELITVADSISIDEYDEEQCRKKAYINRLLLELNIKIADLHDKYITKESVYPVAGNPEESIFTDEFNEYWEEFLNNREADKFDALNRLLVKEGGFLHRTKKVTYFNLLNRNDFIIEGMKTIIFDATAAIDPDYNDKESFVYMYVDDYRDFSNVTIHNYKDINLSRGSFKRNKNNWKNKALAKWFDKEFRKGIGGIFVVTYQKQASIFTELIKNKRVKYDNIAQMIAYFNNTKGKNNWKDSYDMVQFGWNNKDSNDYLARAYSRSITDFKEAWDLIREKPTIADELADYFKNTFGVFNNSLIAELYKHCHIAAEFEQEIFRTAMRKYGETKPINIYVFNMNETVRSIIWHRLNGTVKFEHINGEFDEWIKEKSKTHNNGNDTVLSKFLDWYSSWDGNEFSIKQLKALLNISENQWKDLKKKKEFKKVLENFEHKRRGKDHYYLKIAS